MSWNLFAPGRGRKPARRRFQLALEALEDRRLLAQVLFGGGVLQETFDDLPTNAITSGTLDDPGYLNGTAVGAAVFHHDLAGFSLGSGGTTTPTTQPPGQTA